MDKKWPKKAHTLWFHLYKVQKKKKSISWILLPRGKNWEPQLLLNLSFQKTSLITLSLLLFYSIVAVTKLEIKVIAWQKIV